jgi:OOP family OmpA-OmpF porin
MKITRTSSALLGVAALAAFAPATVLAQGEGASWYGGASVGRTRATIDDERITRGLAGQGLGTNSIEDRENDRGFKLFGGYQFTRNFGLEGGYFDLGEFGYTATTRPAGSLVGDIRVRGLNLDVVGTLPITQRFSVLGRVGATYSRTEGGFSATGAARVPYASASTSERSTNYKYGVGMMYDFTENLALRVEAERYRIRDSVGNRGDVDMLSLGLLYRFGSSPAPARPVAAAWVAPAAAPAAAVAAPAATVTAAAAPAPAPAPQPEVLKRVTLSADSLFAFDSSAVSSRGRVALDQLAGDLRGLRYDSIHVTGHTDRLGTERYNEALSGRRAKAVADYLVQAGGVARDKVAAVSAGESRPVTAAGACRGNVQTPALVSCLQADRRVEVEVQGTR